jgi:hypothetical protein
MFQHSDVAGYVARSDQPPEWILFAGSASKDKSPMLTFRLSTSLKTWVERQAKWLKVTMGDFVRMTLESARRKGEKSRNHNG